MTVEVKVPQRPQVTMKPTPDDLKILAKLKDKLGVSEADIFRIGIRRLAELEGIQ